jgi:hypothetical protein
MSRLPACEGSDNSLGIRVDFGVAADRRASVEVRRLGPVRAQLAFHLEAGADEAWYSNQSARWCSVRKNGPAPTADTHWSTALAMPGTRRAC